jgi:ABC-2 type transport system permease protein
MRKNVFMHEFREKLKSVLYWSLGIAGIHLLYLSIYPSFADQAALINKMMQNFPPEFRAAFGMNGVDLSTVMGFYSFVFLLVQIMLAIQASNYGVGLVSVEESELTADFLLSKPISRAQILVSKFLATFAAMTITNGAVWASAYSTINLFRGNHPYDPRLLAILLGSIVVLQMFFFSVGLLISLIVRRIRNVTPYGLGLAFGMYVLGALSKMEGETILEWITPFKHFDSAYVIQHGGYDMRMFWLEIAVIVFSLAISYWRYLHRDIPAVV